MFKKEKEKKEIINNAKRKMIDEIVRELSLKEKPISKKWLKGKDAWLYEKTVDRLIGHNWAIKEMFAIVIRLRKKYEKGS